MPLFFQQDINEDTRLAVWHITEDEAFFRSMAVPQREVLHPHKRLQHLAGRYLLRHLFPDFPTELILIADTRKPFLENETYHFSISHCGDYAAAIVSRSERVGVDIETITEKAARVKHKFVSGSEWEVIGSDWSVAGEGTVHPAAYIVNQKDALNSELLQHQKEEAALIATLVWSCKEAVFKWFGNGEMDFKEHMIIQGCKQVAAASLCTEILLQKNEPEMLMVHSRLLDRLWLSYVVS